MTPRAVLGRRAPAVAAMAVGAAVTVLGSLLPWVRTGGARRNSYDVFAIVGRLGFAPDGPAAVALRWWPLMPLLAVSSVVVAGWGWRRAGGALGIASATYAGGVAAAVGMAPAGGVVGIGPGVALTVIGATVLLGASVAGVVIGEQGSRPDATTSTDRAR